VVKLVFFCRRRAELSSAQFAERLLHGHVPLALRHHPTMAGYVVNLVESVPADFPEADSVGELWFRSLEDFEERLYDSPAGRAAIEHDVASFLAAADAYLTREHVQKDEHPRAAPGARSPGVKLVCPVRRREGMTHEAFVAHWLDTHVPLALRHHPGLSRYVTNVVERRLSPAAADWDGIAELHFGSDEALAAGMFDSSEGERAIRADMGRFIGRTAAYRVSEWVQKRA
jgi:uncharacterized protein (TIGR02118 family)